MKKFKNIKTGAILAPNSSFVEEQMVKSDLYEEIEEKAKELTVKEIKKILYENKIEYDAKATRDVLFALIPEQG